MEVARVRETPAKGTQKLTHFTLPFKINGVW